MNSEQLRLARHALGLPNRTRRSYRNRFLSGGECPDWRAMEATGHAESSKPDEHGRIWFWLTRAGAEAALKPGESLCPEDFPAPDTAARKHLSGQNVSLSISEGQSANGGATGTERSVPTPGGLAEGGRS